MISVLCSIFLNRFAHLFPIAVLMMMMCVLLIVVLSAAGIAAARRAENAPEQPANKYGVKQLLHDGANVRLLAQLLVTSP